VCRFHLGDSGTHTFASIQSTLADVALLFDEPIDSNTHDDDTTSFTASIFSHLYKMSLVRQQILEVKIHTVPSVRSLTPSPSYCTSSKS
jgi:hypothetical protein